MTKLNLSIAMCTYNGGIYLKDQLDSIALQERLPDELIICDDNSNDNTTEILREFSSMASFPVNITVNPRRIGVIKNFEKAISFCKGDIIFLSDQDDIWHSKKLLLMEAIFLKDAGIGAIISDAKIVNENLKPKYITLFKSHLLSPHYFDLNKQRRFLSGESFSIVANHKIVTGCTMAFRSHFRKMVLPIPDIWIHDRWIALIIAAFADLNIIRQPMGLYRQHSNNVIGGPSANIASMLYKTNKYGISFYLNEIHKYNIVYERLLTCKGANVKPGILIFLKNKIDHLDKCSRYPRDIIKRLIAILNEYNKDGYYNYSCGWQQAMLDLYFYK